MDAILDCRKTKNQLQYLIKWKGYGPEENSWEPESNIHTKQLIQALCHRYPEKLTQLVIKRLAIRGASVRKGKMCTGAKLRSDEEYLLARPCLALVYSVLLFATCSCVLLLLS